MKKLNILYLEDSAEDAELAAYALKKAGISFSFNLVDSKEEYEEALQQSSPDLILADHSLFHFNSLEALKIFKSAGLKIPFILVTGTVSEEFAVDILQQGADDYLLKKNLARLPNAILQSLEKYRIENERQEFFNRIIANETLMKEAERLALFGSWEIDTSSGDMIWSAGFYRLLGYEPGEINPVHDIILRHIHPEDRTFYQQVLYSHLLSQDMYSSGIRIVDKAGAQKEVFFKIVVSRNGENNLSRLLGFFQDVTEKRKLEKELTEQALHQQKLITEVTIQAQEKERNELGRELHDNINQILATVKMYIGMAVAKEKIPLDLIQTCHQYVTEAMDEIRKLSHSLVAPSLGDIGLPEALQELAATVNATAGPQVRFVNELPAGQALDMKKQLMLYRIAQEAINNIRKYAKATEVLILLKTTPGNIFMSVADNGIGFDLSKTAKGIGLKNIQTRAEFYAGSLNIVTSPGKGCILEINIPL